MAIFRRILLVVVAASLGAFAAPPMASAGHAKSINLKFPRFSVPPRSDREVCTFVKLPRSEPFDAAGTLIVNHGNKKDFTSHHFLLYAYTGTRLDEFAALQGVIKDSKGCIDFGPTDTTTRVLIGGSQSERSLQMAPPGLATQILPTVAGANKKAFGLILNSHWINGTDATQHASVKIKIMPAKPHTVKRYLIPIFEVVANGFLKVPPHQVSTLANWSWAPGGVDLGGSAGGVPVPRGAACVVQVTAHMHKRGKKFAVNFVDHDGSKTPLFEATDYSDPGVWPRTDQPLPANWPLLVSPGQALAYECTHDNGSAASPIPAKLGCEETPGEAPGRSILDQFAAGKNITGGAAKRCTQVGPDATECPASDPAFPDRTFTGNCVEANLVFGFTSDDDMCILPGAYYDWDPVNGCDLGPLPVIN
jgi:hypothetical protein